MSVEAVLTPIKYAKALKQLQDSRGLLVLLNLLQHVLIITFSISLALLFYM